MLPLPVPIICAARNKICFYFTFCPKPCLIMVAAEICCTAREIVIFPRLFSITSPFSFGIVDPPVWHTGLTRRHPVKLRTIFPWLVLPYPQKRVRYPGRRPAPRAAARGGRGYLRGCGRRSARPPQQAASPAVSLIGLPSPERPDTTSSSSSPPPRQRGALSAAPGAVLTAVAWRQARECQFLRRSRR